ncbi:MAG TPA: ribose-5-phosphate isomerase A, partial [Chlamydiales bacterium]|nr:ribose-5-phosphate isomerase A [Chlamydiales bacterium]
MHTVDIKKQIGQKAATLVEDGMIIGLGTGTTAAFFIESLAALNKKITAAATSRASEELALLLGIRCVPIDSVNTIDITFDGADEIDNQKRLLKGAGGALLREKIIASASR